MILRIWSGPLFLIFVLAGSVECAGWRGIIPLHSTRTDVERQLGKPLINRPDLAVYDYETERVSVEYSIGRCNVEFSMWNVPKDTVIGIVVIPKGGSVNLPDQLSDQTAFRKVPDDHREEYVHYVNEKDGIQYTVDEKSRLVTLIRYVPAASDIRLKCRDPENRLPEPLRLANTLVTAVPQETGSSYKQGCTLLDKTQAPQFISYETKLASTIRLRLRNNTSCPIVVETDDQHPTQVKRPPQGGASIEAVLSPQDGLRLPLHYLIQNRRRRESLTRAYGWGDSVFTYEIPPGQSIVFDVPTAHFRRRLDIAVPFGYEWEGHNSIATGVGGVAHRVYFLFDSLPAVALR